MVLEPLAPEFQFCSFAKRVREFRPPCPLLRVEKTQRGVERSACKPFRAAHIVKATQSSTFVKAPVCGWGTCPGALPSITAALPFLLFCHCSQGGPPHPWTGASGPWTQRKGSPSISGFSCNTPDNGLSGSSSSLKRPNGRQMVEPTPAPACMPKLHSCEPQVATAVPAPAGSGQWSRPCLLSSALPRLPGKFPPRDAGVECPALGSGHWHLLTAPRWLEPAARGENKLADPTAQVTNLPVPVAEK